MIEGFELLGYVFLLSFGLSSLGLGVLTAKFGSGPSRTIGIILAVIGIAAVGIFYYLQEDCAVEIFKVFLASGIGALVGGLLGLFIFLIAIMKS